MAASCITTPIQMGPRLRAELERRVRELERRFKPAPRDMRELAQLKEFLKATPITERDGRESSSRPPLTTPNGFGGVRHG
jgi:hypothetical protein